MHAEGSNNFRLFSPPCPVLFAIIHIGVVCRPRLDEEDDQCDEDDEYVNEDKNNEDKNVTL